MIRDYQNLCLFVEIIITSSMWMEEFKTCDRKYSWFSNTPEQRWLIHIYLKGKHPISVIDVLMPYEYIN